jgi:hypothetical protein
MQQGNWKTFGFSRTKTIEHVDAVEDQERRAAEIIDILTIYRNVDQKWRQALRDAPNGLQKSNTDEYAEVLGCPPDFDAIAAASFQILTVWPVQTVPLLESILGIIGSEAESTQLLRIQDWENLSQRYYFDIRRVRTELERIEQTDAKIQALKDVRSAVVENGRSGALIVVDPTTGNPVQSEEEDAYDRVVEMALKDYLDPELFKLETMPYVAARKKKEQPTHNPHMKGAIKWRKSLPALVTLLEELLSRGLVAAEYHELAYLLVYHFCDKWEFPYSVEEALPHFSMTPRMDSSEQPEQDSIVWIGDLVPLCQLVYDLIHKGYVSNNEDDYKSLITTHFVNGTGGSFNEGSLRSTKAKVVKLRKEEEETGFTPENLRAIERVLGEVSKLEWKYG